MNNILTMLVRWFSNYFTISENEIIELEISVNLAMDKSINNFQHSDNKYFRGV